MGVIFDLDQTIIDSKNAKNLRSNRDWKAVYNQIPTFQVYDGMVKLIDYLHDNKIEVAIVTSSPRKYCMNVINHHNIKIDNQVCYHDTAEHKPNPAPLNKAKEYFSSDKIISFGDDFRDIIAAQKAGIIAVACLWDADDKDSLIKANPDFICNNVQEAFALIKSFFA